MKRQFGGGLGCLVLCCAFGAAPNGEAPGVATPGVATPGVVTPGVSNSQRAWQNWTLNCQGCHRPDATGSAATTPSLAAVVAKFLRVEGGRDYLVRVPGVATSPLADAELSEVLNWMLWRFDREHVPATFVPFTAVEVAVLRKHPLRVEASRMRADLMAQLDVRNP